MQPHYSKHHTLVAKGVGCLLLLLYHLFYAPSFSAAQGVSTFFLSLEQLAKYTAIGNVCVTLFILLSGYGIAASLQNAISPRGVFTRLLLRIIRLYGAFWFVYILFAPWQTVFDNWNYSHFGYAVIDFFGLAHFFGEQTINGAWWYLAILLLCYILTPLFLLFLRGAPIFLTSVIIFLAVTAKYYDLVLISTYVVGMLLHRFEL